jgi:hypothetical protein
MFFKEAFNPCCCGPLYLAPFVKEWTEEVFGHFMQKSVTACLADFSVTALEEVFGTWLIT